MDIFLNRKLNPLVFEMELRSGTHDLNDILLAAVRSGSSKIETTHILIALGHMRGSATQRELDRIHLSVEKWEEGLVSCLLASDGLPPDQLNMDCLDATVLKTLEGAAADCERYKLERINDSILLLNSLRNLTDAVDELFQEAGLDIEDWCTRLERQVVPIEIIPIFDENGELVLDVFSAGAKKVLSLMRTEAESLGYERIDPRHLLLGLVEREGQVTQYGLFQQGHIPRKIQETTMLSLRGRAKKTRSNLPLQRANIQIILSQILSKAAETAARDREQHIGETYLLRALLMIESSALRILRDEKVDLAALRRTAEEYVFDGEEEEEDTLADIETVKERLFNRIVGQDDAIGRVLPYVQRMRFGFTVPGKPVGVFLFCGQSGSGKTEMAKELARSVYGSEENLIFLEMGQFNAPESMNIFVGAPPGYIGYGEGKLTNGLRDKPRSVVLFDEVEKAHARVLDALLRFLDEGKIDDPAGPVRDGSQCILILTSNVGAEELSLLWKELKDDPDWRATIRTKLRDSFKKHNFRVEFLNRVDELILFRTLEEASYSEIARRNMKRHLARLEKDHQIQVLPDPSVALAIGSYCATINEGARAVLRLVQGIVITPVIDYVLTHNCHPPLKLKVSAQYSSNDPGMEPQGIVELVS